MSEIIPIILYVFAGFGLAFLFFDRKLERERSGHREWREIAECRTTDLEAEAFRHRELARSFKNYVDAVEARDRDLITVLWGAPLDRKPIDIIELVQQLREAIEKEKGIADRLAAAYRAKDKEATELRRELCNAEDVGKRYISAIHMLVETRWSIQRNSEDGGTGYTVHDTTNNGRTIGRGDTILSALSDASRNAPKPAESTH